MLIKMALSLVASCFPSGVPDHSVFKVQSVVTPFAIAERNSSVTVAAEANISLYPPHDLKSLFTSFGTDWQEEYHTSPEAVSLFRHVFRLQGAPKEEARLYRRKMDGEAIMARKPDPPLADFLTRLSNWHFLQQVQVGDFAYVMLRNRGGDKSKGNSVPVVLRRYDDRYYLTRENNLASIVNWVLTVTPEFDPRKKSVVLSSARLEDLVAFELLPDYGSETIELASWNVRYANEVDLPRKSGSDSSRMLLFARLISDPAQGYGQAIIAEPESVVRLPELEELVDLLSRAWKATSPADHKILVLSKYHWVLDNRQKKWAEWPYKPRPHEYPGVPILTRGTLDRSARLLATIDGGVGYIHFFWNPPEARLSPGKVVHVVVQEEDGAPRLGDSFAGDEAAVSEIFATPEFKEGLIEYLKLKHADVLEKAGYPLP